MLALCSQLGTGMSRPMNSIVAVMLGTPFLERLGKDCPGRITMPGPDTDASDGTVSTQGKLPSLALASRAVAFLALWSIVAQTDPSSMVVGSVAALVAAWESLRLLPAGRVGPRPAPLVRLACRFAWQSLFAGADVARRAMDPRLPLRTGFVRYPAPHAARPGSRRVHGTGERGAGHLAGWLRHRLGAARALP